MYYSFKHTPAEGEAMRSQQVPPRTTQKRRMLKMLEKVEAALLAVIPSGKALAFLIPIGLGIFLAGIGFRDQTAQIADVPQRLVSDSIADERLHTELAAAIASNARSIILLSARADSAAADRRQILCLVTLTVTGEQLTPLQVRQRCP